MADSKPPHSAAYFGDFRDYWWNRDFLELMGRRWRLDQVHTVLDVGCGVGHWGRILAEVLPPAATIEGIDLEPEWIEVARTNAPSKFHYGIGDALAIPFDDGRFDLVTCQTVLIHVKDPLAAIREMFRVVKPGGLIVAAEPNNRVGTLMANSLSMDNSVDEILKAVRLQITGERGKRLLGEGDSSLGDLVPGLFAVAGMESIHVYLSDKTSALFPPYSSEEQQTLLRHSREMTKKGIWNWEYTEAKRYFIAGGGNEAEFYALWNQVTADDGSFNAAIANSTFHGGGAAVMYLVSGRKPR
jgi:SAM-dependent methyltransferase